jgi:2-methylisocitrate lyase-like PEP mutase family enzyme
VTNTALADPTARRAVFRTLHERGCFLIPNPWDIGSARYLQGLGFKALATTSAGFAFSLGQPDSAAAVPLEASLAHFAALAAASDLPVNADFQNGYADTPAGVGENVRRCVETGVAGLSIEDSTGDPRRPLYDLDEAVARLKAARAAIDASGTGVLLTARAECHLVGTPDPLPDSIRRLQAYAKAGADVLYAPGPSTRADIKAIIDAVAPKPVNVLIGWQSDLALEGLAEMGARRVSVGAALARAAWTGFIRAARTMAETGRFDGLQGAVPFAELNAFFEADRRRTVQ